MLAGATPSVLSGSGVGKLGKRKRKGAATAAGSTVGSAKDGQSGNGAGSLVNGQGQLDDEEGEDEQDGDDVELQATLEGGKMSEAALKQEREHLAYVVATQRSWVRLKVGMES